MELSFTTHVFFNPGYPDALINLAKPLVRVCSVSARSDSGSRYRICAFTLYSFLNQMSFLKISRIFRRMFIMRPGSNCTRRRLAQTSKLVYSFKMVSTIMRSV